MERLLIKTPGRPAESEILIRRGLPEALLPRRESRGMAAIFTQAGAVEIARQVSSLVNGAPILELPDREGAKSLETAQMAYKWLAALELGRYDSIIGVGGGAVTDAAGFVGATWLRGVEVVLVPTTLLSAVDASIGGKTGINLAGKNLVGAFHLPSRVVIDLNVLDRLPPELRTEGAAEILKAGLVGDLDLVELYERHGAGAPLEEVVPRAVAVKADVVSGDFREDGRRAILNFGHTVGHAVEIIGAMPHGPAVAVGMIAAGVVSSARYGFPLGRLKDLTLALGLPVSAVGLSSEAVFELINRDKKRAAGSVRMVLLRAISDPVVEAVSREELQSALEAIGVGPG